MVNFVDFKLLLAIGAGVALCGAPGVSHSEELQQSFGGQSAVARTLAVKTKVRPDFRSEAEKAASSDLGMSGATAGRASRKGAESIFDALQIAYLNNPQLKAQRANTRSVDENLQIAFGSFMPKISGQAGAGILSFNLLNARFDASAFGGRDGLDLKTNTNPAFGAITGTINIFNGFKGVNGINQSEAQIHQSRELLRASEMSVFLATVQSYMAVLNDAATLRIRKNYADVVNQQLAVAREKVVAGEISSTDLKEIETYLAQAEKNAIAANTALQGSIAYYRRVTGQSPNAIGPASSISEKLPKSLEIALQTGFAEHPLVVAARYNVDINKYAINIAESGLLPTVDLVTSYGQNWNYFGTQGQRLYQGGGGIVVNVPFYDGGVSYSSTRQAKERLAEAEALFDLQISQIRQQIETSWAAWTNSGRLLEKARQQAAYAAEALAGLRYEIGFGLRTTWDVLNYQQILTDARVSLVNAQRDRVIASYTLLAATGGLSADNLQLSVPRYDPLVHYERVKFQLFGTEPR